ncbi:hypothetical protein BUALT_Bualt18G0110100 [Buddleja alternifolia]|uniref:Uncharacterized protein n=1 Tax=Buddleja alternifolia TaxID=168488 RepID=A0AAV6W4P7_9LAMI|nr:hypothetical protein BUALT_Bualt18G0110100 [Buddleja alternifolia]
MDSLSSAPPPPPHHHIYVTFCSKELGQSTTFSNCIARFDPSNNTWNHVSSIKGLPQNHVLKDFAMTSIGDFIYIIGGRLCRKERIISSDYSDSNDFSETDVQVFSTVYRYNVKSNQWSNCAPLSVPRYNFACTVCDNKIYVAGGQYELASCRSTPSAEVYDPSANEWTQLPDMRIVRCKCVGVTWRGKVHVIGGFVEGCDLDQSIAYVGRCSVEVYDEERGQWDLVKGMWQLDVPPNQIVALEGKLFSSGDCLNAWKGHIEAYDGKINLWNVVEGSQMKSLCCTLSGGEDNDSQNMKRLYVTMALIGSYLYFLAGYKVVGDAWSTVTMVHRFDTFATENAWTSFDPSREEGRRELCSHCCVVTHI